MPFLLVRWSLPSCASANFYSSDMSTALPAFNRSEYQFLFSWIEIWPAKQRLFLQSMFTVHITGITLWTTREIMTIHNTNTAITCKYMHEFQLLPSLQALYYDLLLLYLYTCDGLVVSMLGIWLLLVIELVFKCVHTMYSCCFDMYRLNIKLLPTTTKFWSKQSTHCKQKT